jgi:hypothetical protein
LLPRVTSPFHAFPNHDNITRIYLDLIKLVCSIYGKRCWILTDRGLVTILYGTFRRVMSHELKISLGSQI